MMFFAADVSTSAHVYDINFACVALIGIGGLHNCAENIVHFLIESKNFDAFFGIQGSKLLSATRSLPKPWQSETLMPGKSGISSNACYLG